MTCRSCGTDLPSDALFCGECGRAVLEPSLVTAGSVEAPGDGLSDAYARFAPPATRSARTESLLCPQCDSAVDDADVFCGECGFVLKAVVPGPRDAVAVEPEAPVARIEPEAAEPAAPEAGEPEPTAEAEAPAAPVEPAEPVVSAAREEDAIVQTDHHRDEDLAPAGVRGRGIPDPFPWGAEVDDDEDVEATRIVAAGGGGDRFVLQFSTGESVTVSGAGLIGRNPAAQPGEYVDQLVSIFDAGKSVSKTHLEFGQEGGRFWVSDRYSTNGSVVRQPEAEPRRCEPGRRYFVVRGTRIDIGEQFFVVS